MINLLAPETKGQLRAAKRNVLLRRYFLLVLSISFMMIGSFGVGYYITWRDKDMADKERAQQIAQLKDPKTLEIKDRAEAYTKNLATAKVIIGKQASASKFLTDLAATLPKNVILSQITLSSTVTTTPTLFKARAKAFGDVLNLKENLEKSPLFESVSVVSAQLPDSEQASDSSDLIAKAYPVDATISLIISSGGGS